MLRLPMVLWPAHGRFPALQQYCVTQYSPIIFADGQLTDLASFYTLPSSVIGHDRHTEMRAAFHYYTVSWRQQDASAWQCQPYGSWTCLVG